MKKIDKEMTTDAKIRFCREKSETFSEYNYINFEWESDEKLDKHVEELKRKLIQSAGVNEELLSDKNGGSGCIYRYLQEEDF